MNITFLIGTVLFGILAYYFNKKYKEVSNWFNAATNKIGKKNQEITKYKHIKMIQETSIKNFKNALEEPPNDDYKSHFRINSLEDEQQIIILFEEEKEYDSDMQSLLKEKGLDSKKFSRELDCTVFIDGKKFDPILLAPIFKDQQHLEIQDINCMNYKGRGVGTYTIRFLEEILKEIGINKIFAKLSPVDYKNKEKLYNFYINKNGFTLKKELTSSTSGLVEKQIY
jgi:translation initiation factor 2 beta subunit (eIF-2beta)/eIF-5